MMEEVHLDTGDENYDSYDDDDNYRPPTERWAPLGAAAPPPEPKQGQCSYEEIRLALKVPVSIIHIVNWRLISTLDIHTLL